MTMLKTLKLVGGCVGIIIIMFVAASILDIILAVLNSRFYSTAAFIVIFGVAGIFAGVVAFHFGAQESPEKTESARWRILTIIIATGFIFFFVLAKLEGGEYESAFRSFGLTTAFSSLLFLKGKME